jgi:hypothetical protein
VAPLVARLAAVVLALVCAGCGSGGGDGNGNHSAHGGVKAFPDALEVARAELGDDTTLVAIEVTPKTVSFTRIQFGRTRKLTYNSQVVFTGAKDAKPPKSPAEIFTIDVVSADAPARLIEAIEEREGGAVEGFTATLRQPAPGKLGWRVKATVEGVEHEYTAAPDGTLQGD